MNYLHFHSQAVQWLLENLPFKDKKKAVVHMARTLGISETSMYNKLAERCRFSLDEFLLLCKKYHLSPDQLLAADESESKTSHTFFHAMPCAVAKTADLYIAFSGQWQQIYQWQTTEMCVFPQSIPVMHLHKFPNLLYMVLYYEQLWTSTKSQDEIVYAPELFLKDPRVWQAIQSTESVLQSVSVRDIWHPSAMDSILVAYKRLVEAGLIYAADTIEALQQEMLTFPDILLQNDRNGIKPDLSRSTGLSPSSNFGNWLLFCSENKSGMCRLHTGLVTSLDISNSSLFQYHSTRFEDSWSECNLITGTGRSLKNQYISSLKRKTEDVIRTTASLLPDREGGEQPLHLLPGNIPAEGVPYRLGEP